MAENEGQRATWRRRFFWSLAGASSSRVVRLLIDRTVGERRREEGVLVNFVAAPSIFVASPAPLLQRARLMPPEEWSKKESATG